MTKALKDKYWNWWYKICQKEILPLLNNFVNGTRLSDKIVCVCDYEESVCRMNYIRDLFALHGQVSIIDGGNVNYNTLKETIQRVIEDQSDIVVVDQFDKILNKTNCSLVDTFLLKQLCSQKHISAIVLISTSREFSFDNLPNCYKRK